MSMSWFLTGMELIFFLVAGMMLCCGCRMRIMLITHRCFSCSWAVLTWSQGLLGSFWAGRGQQKKSWPKVSKGMVLPLLWDWLGNSQQVMSNCFVHHTFCIFLIIIFPSLPVLLTVVISTHEFYLFFVFSHLSCVGGGGWASRDVVLSCLLDYTTTVRKTQIVAWIQICNNLYEASWSYLGHCYSEQWA